MSGSEFGDNIFVALRQVNVLAVPFYPELTADKGLLLLHEFGCY
jgi:glutamine amidotransferase PdxT